VSVPVITAEPPGGYPAILDTALVAQMLGVSVDTVRRWTREGKLPAHRLPGTRSYRYFTDEVLEFLRSQPATDPSDELLLEVEREDQPDR